MLLSYMCQQKYAPQMPHGKITQCASTGPIYMPHMNSVTSTMSPGVLYTDHNYSDDNTDNATAQLH